MNSSTIDASHLTAITIQLTEDSLRAELADGCTVSVPIDWYPRLAHATEAERSNWRFIGGGRGVHWPELDEDVSVENLLLGKPSAESGKSLKRWLETRLSK